MRHRQSVIAALCGVAGVIAALLVGPAPASAGGQVTQDTTAKTVTATAPGLSVTFSYANQVAVTSLQIDGAETLQPGSPGYSTVQFDADGSTVSSLAPSSSPTVSITNGIAQIAFAMSNATASVAETWSVGTDPTDVSLSVTRQITWASGGSGNVRDSSMPQLTFGTSTWQNAHLPGSGGSIPLWSTQLVNASKATLNDGSPAFPSGLSLETAGNRVVQEQNSVVLLNHAAAGALAITGSTSGNGSLSFLRQGTSSAPGGLTTSWEQSVPAWAYKNGNTRGYTDPVSPGGKFATGSALLFSPVTVSNNQTDSVQLKFSRQATSDSYNIGALSGFDSTQVAAAIKDFGAAIMQDSTNGASSERSFRSAQAPPFTMLQNVYSAELLQSDAAFKSIEQQFLDIRSSLQEPSGMMSCCSPHAVNPIPSNQPNYRITDGIFAYASAAATLYDLHPDVPWLQQMKPSIESALAYADSNLKITSGLTSGLYGNINCGTPAPATGCTAIDSDWNDLYAIGQVDAYQNLLAFHALSQWSSLESGVLSSPGVATTYATDASTLKSKFNANGSAGGFWSPATSTFAYTRDSSGALVKDCESLFANGYALQWGIVSDSRARMIAGQLRTSYYNTFWHIHGSNPINCASGEGNLYFPFFEDGGGEFAVEQPAGEIGVALADRSYDVSYAHAIAERYPLDNFWGWSSIQPDSLTVRRDIWQEPWMGNNILGLWPLFHDVLGFHPSANGLEIEPFIDNSLVGSSVPYSVWGQHPVTVNYTGIETYQITTDGSIPVSVGWKARQAGASYSVHIDGATQQVTADSTGKVEVQAPAGGGTHTYSIDTVPNTILDDSSATYSGTWGPDASSLFFGGTIEDSSSAGATATFDFTGDSIGYIGSTGTDKGQAEIYVDGKDLGAVDYYSTTPSNQKTIFSQSGFGGGGHQLQIKVLGSKNPASSGTQINVDGIILPGAPPSSDYTDDSHFTYTGSWFTDASATFLDGTIHDSTSAGAVTTERFAGTRVTIIGAVGTDKGQAQISVDGGTPTTIDFYSPTSANQVSVATLSGLAPGEHTLTLTVLGQKSASSTGIQVALDGIATAP